MKKLFKSIIVLGLSLSLLAACGSEEESKKEEVKITQSQEKDMTEELEVMTKMYGVGINYEGEFLFYEIIVDQAKWMNSTESEKQLFCREMENEIIDSEKASKLDGEVIVEFQLPNKEVVAEQNAVKEGFKINF